ncbi:MAG: FTR1 family protein [Gammaproteobacteria bacterium]|nr:FTR1 family protein [Gammaproteobacteria bacterium]
MLSALIIVFREVLEAALVIGIVCAATRGVKGRGAMVTFGIGAGIAGAMLVARRWGADRGSGSRHGAWLVELFNALILLTVVVMLGAHILWMSRHGEELARDAGRAGESVRSGQKPPRILAALVGLAVLREGSEVVLFLYGIAAGGSTAAAMLTGSVAGVGLGALVGFALYSGLLTIPSRHLFAVSSALLTLLAAGMAGQAAKFLIQADYLPPLGYLWDSSWLIRNDSVVGTGAGPPMPGYEAGARRHAGVDGPGRDQWGRGGTRACSGPGAPWRGGETAV